MKQRIKKKMPKKVHKIMLEAYKELVKGNIVVIVIIVVVVVVLGSGEDDECCCLSLFLLSR